MMSILLVMTAAFVLIAVPYTLSADGSVMKTVPFWWSTDPLTGEEVYTDYFKESSDVQREHNAYLAQTASNQVVSTISPSILLEAERSSMVEVITYETKYIRAGDSAFEQGPFSNPDYMIKERVATSTWIYPQAIEEVIPEEITLEVTPEAVPDVIEDITPVEVDVVEVVEDLPRVSSFKGNTHWDVEEATMSGHDYMTPQQIKDHKKHVAEWKAYEYLSTTYPSQYPAYVHDYDSDDKHDKLMEDDLVVVVPLN